MKTPTAKKLPSGNWRTQLRINGKVVSITADTRRECESQALLLKAKYQTGAITAAPAEITLEEAIDRYIKSRNQILSPSTIRGYEIIKRNRFQSVMNRRLKDVKNWQAVINKESTLCKPKTLKNAWGFVSSVLRENHVDPGNVRLPMVIPEEQPFLDPDQIRIFMKAIENDKYELPYLLCLHGLRRSEMLALEKKDISTAGIRVHASRIPNENHHFVTKQNTKNVSSTRMVPVFFDRLYDLVKVCPDGVLVPYSPDKVLRHLRKICAENDLPEIGFHSLRHSFASLCYHLGISELQAMAFGGWSDLTVMRKIYTHVADSDKKEAVQSIRAFFV